jgi:hypothetical protein
VNAPAKRGVVVAGLSVALLLTLFCASAVASEWRVVPVPSGNFYSIGVVNAQTWMVERPYACCTPEYDLTEDGGASWSRVSIPGFIEATIAGAADDGSFRVVARRSYSGDNQEIQVFRVDSAGAEPLGPAIDGGTKLFQGFGVSGDGETWVPYWSPVQNAFELAIVGADGSTSTVALPEGANTYGWESLRTVLGMRLLRFVPTATVSYIEARPIYQLEKGDEVVPAETYPVSLADGDLMLSSDTGLASWDGGAHWSKAFDRVVPRTSSNEMPRYITFAGGIVAERDSSFLFRGTGLAWPSGVPTNFVVDTGTGLVAWSDDAIYVHEGPLPPMPTAIGSLQPDTERLLARADLFRADAGLPPLTGDALVSVASRNHSTYTALHPKAAEERPHEEEPELTGFTGVFPWDRCEAVGTSCGAEIMFSPGVADPVGGWLATIFHRPLLGSPEAGVVGGAEVERGWAVMDSKGPENVLVGPFGYPIGRWRGEAGFSGEIPDPVRFCDESGQAISYPLGIAVSLYLPSVNGSVSRFYVHGQGESAALPGCLLMDYAGDQKEVGVFILDDPLVRGKTYEVSATWNPGPDEWFEEASIPGPNLTYDWSFHFDPDGSAARRSKPKRRCRALVLRTIKSVARARRDGRSGEVLGIDERVTLKQKARVHLRRARLDYWVAGTRHAVGLKLGRLSGRSIEVGTTSYLRFRLPAAVARRVVAAEPAELELSFSGRRVRGCARKVRIARIRKIQFGWVRVRGPASWVSGGRHSGR